MITPENAVPNSSDSNTAITIRDQAIATLKEANLRLRQSQVDFQISGTSPISQSSQNSPENKNKAELKMVSEAEASLQQNALEKKYTTESITLANPTSHSLKIADLSERLRNYLTKYWMMTVTYGILQFKDEDNINTQVHGLTPLMFLLLSHEFELAAELLTHPGINVQIISSIEDENFSKFQRKSALDIIVLLRFHPEYRIAKKQYPETQAQALAIIEKIAFLCPELIHRRGIYGLDIQGEPKNDTPLSVSILFRDLPCLKLLLQNGQSLSSQNDGSWPLLVAMLYANAENVDLYFDMVLFLLNCHISPDLSTTFERDGGNLLHDCAYVGFPQSFKNIALLLAAGIKYNLPNNAGLTPLQILQQYTVFAQYPEHVQEVMNEEEVQIDVEGRKYLYEILLVIDQFFNSVMSNDLKRVREYLVMDLPVNVRNAKGKTPLHLACENNLPEMILLLASHGAKWTSMDDEQYTPLDRCVERYSETQPAQNRALRRAMNILQPIIDQQVCSWMVGLLKSYKQLKNQCGINLDLNIRIFLFSNHFQKISGFTMTRNGFPFILRAIAKSIESPQILLAAKRVVAAHHEGIDKCDLKMQCTWLIQYKLRPAVVEEEHDQTNEMRIQQVTR